MFLRSVVDREFLCVGICGVSQLIIVYVVVDPQGFAPKSISGVLVPRYSLWSPVDILPVVVP